MSNRETRMEYYGLRMSALRLLHEAYSSTPIDAALLDRLLATGSWCGVSAADRDKIKAITLGLYSHLKAGGLL